MSRVKGEFEKGYVPNWSEEDFRISDVAFSSKTKQQQQQREKVSRGVSAIHDREIFHLQDRGGEDIKGSWYREELQPIQKNRYLIEKVIRKRKIPAAAEASKLVPTALPRRGRKRKQDSTTTAAATSVDYAKKTDQPGSYEVLVKWKGWPNKFNTWIPESDIENLKQQRNKNISPSSQHQVQNE